MKASEAIWSLQTGEALQTIVHFAKEDRRSNVDPLCTKRRLRERLENLQNELALIRVLIAHDEKFDAT